jgi:hypothetical protein
MKTARLKNTFLGIIAINLTLITLIQLDIFPPKAYASENVPTVKPLNTNYGLVPLNENGNVNVEIVGVVDAHCFVSNFEGSTRWRPLLQP